MESAACAQRESKRRMDWPRRSCASPSQDSRLRCRPLRRRSSRCRRAECCRSTSRASACRSRCSRDTPSARMSTSRPRSSTCRTTCLPAPCGASKCCRERTGTETRARGTRWPRSSRPMHRSLRSFSALRRGASRSARAATRSTATSRATPSACRGSPRLAARLSRRVSATTPAGRCDSTSKDSACARSRRSPPSGWAIASTWPAPRPRCSSARTCTSY